MGSCAGAGSGEFHSFRKSRRREYARQSILKYRDIRDKKNLEWQEKVESQKQAEEAKTAKKRAKRLKEKQKKKMKKNVEVKKDTTSEESEESDEEEEKTEEEKEKWAEIALSYSSDGFDKSLSSLEELMDGTSHIFAEGSIFQLLANEEDENVCHNIDVAWDYLGGLWTVGHAVWAQAYKIKHKTDYSAFGWRCEK